MDDQPCIRGLRFPVVTVLRMVAGKMSVDDITSEHPDLEPEDIPAALNYAAEALAEHYYPAEAACVRFLIDKNLSPRICPLLIAAGHPATHIRDHGMASASDPQVLAKAAVDRR